MTQQQPGFIAQIKSYPATFWVANTMEIFERMSWYGFYAVSSLYITGAVETGALGFTSEQRGSIQAIVPFLLYLMPVLTGALADRYGYKKMFVIAYVGMILAYYALGQFKTLPSFLAAFMMVAVAAAIFKPVVVGTVARVTNESNSSIGFGVFYMMVNIGGFFGPIVAGVVRGWSWEYVFWASAGWSMVNLVIVLIFYREPTSEAGSGRARTLKKVMDDAVEVLGNLRFFIAVFVSLIALMVANMELEWFSWLRCAVFVPGWLILNFAWDKFLPADSGRPNSQDHPRRSFVTKRMYCSNWRFALFLLIMSGFWTSFNQIFLTMPEYIRDFTETKPLLDVGRSVFGAIGKPEWADHLASVDDNEVFAEVDRLVRQSRGVTSAIPPEPEKTDPEKLASELRGEIKSKRKEARRYASTRLLDDAQHEQAKQIAADLLAVNKQDIDEMKAAIAATEGPLGELDRLALEAILEKDSSFTPQVRARLDELVREINAPNVEKPLVMLDLVKGTRKILGYKVRLRPVEFGELLTRIPTQASTPSDEALQEAVEKLNKRLREVRRPKFEDEEAQEVIAKLRLLMEEHGPLVSREATVAACQELSSDGRQVEAKQLIVAINLLAYKESVWDLIDAGRQFNPEFIININALGIVCFQVLVSFLMVRFHRFTTMILGMMVAAVGIGLSSVAGGEGMLGAGGVIWVVAGAILIFSFGEMMASPTSQEYVGRIAPRDKVALYMGYYFVAVALGNLFGGILSGQLYGKLARDMQRPDLMWAVFGGIMVATAIVFMLYNKYALPKGATDELMGADA